ncbi:hypothetical protein AB0M39_07910 [Streptomyces sp. NPDC051907]|uniref:hypothetical protein n=1 Tax=Streptomyces sp. NPDC051907 TaxID=3155284 RepID=UPI00341A31E8
MSRRPAPQLAEPFRVLLRSPVTGGPLHWAEPYVLTDGEELWPCLEGIPYLRLRRRAFACRTAGPPARPGRLSRPVAGRPLTVNPLLAGSGRPRWPDDTFARDFTAGLPYLRDLVRPPETTVAAARAGLAGSHSDVDRLAARRVFLDLPESWI